MMDVLKRGAKSAREKLRLLVDGGRVFTGLLSYYLAGNMPQFARPAALRLHCATNGRFTEKLAPPLRLLRPPRPPRTATGFLGTLSSTEQQAFAQSIRENGFHVFDKRLPDALVDQLVAFAAQTPSVVQGYSKSQSERYRFDPLQPLGIKYSVPEDELVRSPVMQQLMADATFLAISEAYLETHPVIADVTLWWSAVHPGTPGEDAGQNYHFDFDTPPGWLMFFFYLTDVDASNGPHIFVRGTHRPNHPKAAELRGRGYARITDRDVEETFGKNQVVEIFGKRGTVLAVDTRGFHKGKALEKGSRLMAQLIFTYPQFAGAHVARQPLPETLHPSLAHAIQQTPRLYQKFL